MSDSKHGAGYRRVCGIFTLSGPLGVPIVGSHRRSTARAVRTSLLLVALVGGGAHAQTTPDPDSPVTFVLDYKGVLRYGAGSVNYQAIGRTDMKYGFVPITPYRTELSANPFYDNTDIGPFGNDSAKTTYFSGDTDTQAFKRSTVSIGRNTDGSGYGHPDSNNYADFGAQIWAIKNDFKQDHNAIDLSAIKEGEVDALSAAAQQGVKGDVAGIILNIEKKRGTTVDNGGAAIFEGVTKIENPYVARSDNPANTDVTWSNQVLAAFAETTGGLSMGKGYGYYSRQDYGEAYAAFGAVNGYHGGHFKNILAFGTSEAPNTEIFRIDSEGFVHQSIGAAGTITGFVEGGNAWEVKNSDDTFLFGVSRDDYVVAHGPIIGMKGFDVPVEAAAAVTPPFGGYKRLFFDSADGKLKAKDSSGTVTAIAP